ncbi:unnamed protein product, partial [marine sediment metagenome]
FADDQVGNHKVWIGPQKKSQLKRTPCLTAHLRDRGSAGNETLLSRYSEILLEFKPPAALERGTPPQPQPRVCPQNSAEE